MEKEITSVNNEIVKETVKLQQKKYRDETKSFLLEGFKAIDEAYRAGIEIEKIFLKEDCAEKYSFLKDKFIFTSDAVLKKISTTTTSPNAVAVAKQKLFSFNDIKSAKKVLLLENIKDLGNLGTILRTAVAFSADAVILFGDTVDFYNPKCVRAAVGNLWKIPVVQTKDFDILDKDFGNFERIATLPKAQDTVFLNKSKSSQKPQLIMFGAESDGLSERLIDFSTKKITIEMNSNVESLNLSVSVAVLLYKLMF
jgi:TrmH family RNA methyltransferase